ncbi:Protein SPIRAL1-like 1, partial [Turnera subulata]
VPAPVLQKQRAGRMKGRGVSAGGGQSSLGYLFGSGEPVSNNTPPPKGEAQPANNSPSQKPAASPPTPVDKDIPAGVRGDLRNNYYRSEGQNCGNFITDRPSTKVHAPPGGGSSMGYLFGGSGQ